MGTHRDRRRAVAFLRAQAIRLARELEPLPYGFVALDRELPNAWDLNTAWVDRAPSARALAADLERIQGGAGLGHRQALIADPSSDALVDALSGDGWTRIDRVLMALRDLSGRADSRWPVTQPPPAATRQFLEAFLREEGAPQGEATNRQLCDAADRAVEIGGAIRLGVEIEGAVAAACDLFVRGRTAQIESVMTLPAKRGRGMARALVLDALRRARAAACTLVFLQAEADDWPRELYARLGFEPVGGLVVARRT